MFGSLRADPTVAVGPLRCQRAGGTKACIPWALPISHQLLLHAAEFAVAWPFPFERGRHKSFFSAVSPVTKLDVWLGLE